MTKRRHTIEEINEYLCNTISEPIRYGAAVGYIFAFIFIFVGSLLLLIFWNLEMVSFWNYVPLIIGFGILLALLATRSARSSKKAIEDSAKIIRYREIMLQGKILEAKIDNYIENFSYRLNGIPQTTVYLSVKGDKLKFNTFSPRVRRFKDRDKTTIYFYSEYPDTIILYDLVEPDDIQEVVDEYRLVRL